MIRCLHRILRRAIAAGLVLSCATVRAQDAASFASCIETLRRDLAEARPPVRAESFERYTREVQDLRLVISAATVSQPEFKLPIWDYIARLVDLQRIADGKAVLAAQAAALQAIAARRGVDAATVVAVFGVETDYGRVEGKHRVVDATLSRACLDLQSKERKRHFYAALWLLQEGVVQPDAFRGSWAGAFGLTQFMPGTFIANMDDGDGSGKVDVIGSAPDALATTARFIAGLGWNEGLRWGAEAARPPGGLQRDWIATEREHACLGHAEPSPKCRSVEQWAALGVVTLPRGDSGGAVAWPKGTRAALLAPAGEAGPAWLVTRNYQAIWQYNRADAYGLAIGLLSDALRGELPQRHPWPTDDPGLSRAQLLQLQRELIARGHANVIADGYDGSHTRQAIRIEERACGWPDRGRAGTRIARALADAACDPARFPRTPE